MSLMSTTPTPSPATGRSTGFGPTHAGLGHRLVAALALWRERAHQRRQLSALDDRLLRDIGLTRFQVEEEERKPFWRA